MQPSRESKDEDNRRDAKMLLMRRRGGKWEIATGGSIVLSHPFIVNHEPRQVEDATCAQDVEVTTLDSNSDGRLLTTTTSVL